MVVKKTVRESNRALLGEKFLYIGNGSKNKCHSCQRGSRRGMVSKYKGNWFCSENCVVAFSNRKE